MATAKKAPAKKAAPAKAAAPAAKKAAPAKKAAAAPAPVKKAVAAKAPAAPAKKAAAPAAKKAAPAKKAAAPAKAAATKRTPNAAFMKALTPSDALAAIIGKGPFPRTEVTKKIWDYIKKNKLQDEVQKRIIIADAKLKAIFGKAKADMFEMTKLVNQHLK